MFKRASLSATIAVLTLVALPAASQAGDRPCLDRVGAHMARAAGDVGRTVMRVGHEVMRTGDRMLGWLLCDKRAS